MCKITHFFTYGQPNQNSMIFFIILVVERTPCQVECKKCTKLMKIYLFFFPPIILQNLTQIIKSGIFWVEDQRIRENEKIPCYRLF